MLCYEFFAIIHARSMAVCIEIMSAPHFGRNISSVFAFDYFIKINGDYNLIAFFDKVIETQTTPTTPLSACTTARAVATSITPHWREATMWGWKMPPRGNTTVERLQIQQIRCFSPRKKIEWEHPAILRIQPRHVFVLECDQAMMLLLAFDVIIHRVERFLTYCFHEIFSCPAFKASKKLLSL